MKKINISFVYFSKKSPFHSSSSFICFPFLVLLCVGHSVEVCSFECGGDWRSVCSIMTYCIYISASQE